MSNDGWQTSQWSDSRNLQGVQRSVCRVLHEQYATSEMGSAMPCHGLRCQSGCQSGCRVIPTGGKCYDYWYDNKDIQCSGCCRMKASVKRQKPRLATEIEKELQAGILAGRPLVGEKLPTERALCLQYGVSRTVIREAIAGLRAAGLIESRRGSGLFVRASKPQTPLWQTSMPEMQAEIVAIVDALELRAAVEIEAASLAATRASPGQIALIRGCHQQFAEAIATGSKTEDVDFAFHQAIAEATNNSAYRSFMEYLGKRTIPRSKLGMETRGEPYQAYLKDMQAEHLQILEAIEEHDADQARQAMQAHLLGSLERYRVLARNQG